MQSKRDKAIAINKRKLAMAGKPHHDTRRNEINGYGETVSNIRTSHLPSSVARRILTQTAINERKRGNHVDVPQVVKTNIAVVKPAFWDKRGGYDGHDIEVHKKDGTHYRMGTSRQINGKYSVHVWQNHGKK